MRIAARALDRMQPKVARAIANSPDAIAADPFAHHANVELLSGGKDEFRLRHGKWRILYRLDRKAQRVIVEVVDTRGEVYK